MKGGWRGIPGMGVNWRFGSSHAWSHAAMHGERMAQPVPMHASPPIRLSPILFPVLAGPRPSPPRPSPRPPTPPPRPPYPPVPPKPPPPRSPPPRPPSPPYPPVLSPPSPSPYSPSPPYPPSPSPSPPYPPAPSPPAPASASQAALLMQVLDYIWGFSCFSPPYKCNRQIIFTAL